MDYCHLHLFSSNISGKIPQTITMSNLKAALKALKNTQSQHQQIAETTTQRLGPSTATLPPTPQQQPTPQPYINPITTSRDLLKNTIKQERIKKNWTQRDLAREAGMSQTTINRIEKYGWTSLDSMMRVAVALGKNLTIT